VVPKNPTSDGFPGETRLWRLGGLAMSRTSAPPVDVARTRAHLRRDAVDHWVVSYCARGAHLATTAGTSVEVPSRVPYLWSLGQEFHHERTHVDRVQLFMTRDAFPDIAPVFDAALGSTLDTPLGHLLGDYMIALERRLPIVTEADLPRLAALLGPWSPRRSPHPRNGRPLPNRKSISAARSACAKPYAGICGRRR
jgi:hypothetical protein